MTPEQIQLRKILDYDPDTGQLIWKVTRGSRARIGTIAGTNVGSANDGRKQMGLNGKRRMNSSVVWFWHHGVWPPSLDHRDGDASNNRIKNLRISNQQQNSLNRIAWRSRDLPKGVYRSGSRFKAVYKEKHLGSYNTPEEASAAHRGASLYEDGEFSVYERNE